MDGDFGSAMDRPAFPMIVADHWSSWRRLRVQSARVVMPSGGGGRLCKSVRHSHKPRQQYKDISTKNIKLHVKSVYFSRKKYRSDTNFLSYFLSSS